MMTPREGNTFASRNGLSNRFSHMDQLRFLRHRQKPGSKATKGWTARPSLPAGKNHGSGETAGTTPESGCHSPPGHGGQGTTPPVHRQVCGKLTESNGGWSVLGELSVGTGFPRTDSLPPRDNLRVRKKNPRPSFLRLGDDINKQEYSLPDYSLFALMNALTSSVRISMAFFISAFVASLMYMGLSLGTPPIHRPKVSSMS